MRSSITLPSAVPVCRAIGRCDAPVLGVAALPKVAPVAIMIDYENRSRCTTCSDSKTVVCMSWTPRTTFSTLRKVHVRKQGTFRRTSAHMQAVIAMFLKSYQGECQTGSRNLGSRSRLACAGAASSKAWPTQQLAMFGRGRCRGAACPGQHRQGRIRAHRSVYPCLP